MFILASKRSRKEVRFEPRPDGLTCVTEVLFGDTLFPEELGTETVSTEKARETWKSYLRLGYRRIK